MAPPATVRAIFLGVTETPIAILVAATAAIFPRTEETEDGAPIYVRPPLTAIPVTVGI